MPGYRPTPLVELPELATELDVGSCTGQGRVQPSRVAGLQDPRCLLGSELRAEPTQRLRRDQRTSLIELRERSAPATLVTATDGNHGRAVARMAALLGLAARIYVPAGTAEETVEAITSEGAEVAADRPDLRRRGMGCCKFHRRPPRRPTHPGHRLAGLRADPAMDRGRLRHPVR